MIASWFLSPGGAVSCLRKPVPLLRSLALELVGSVATNISLLRSSAWRRPLDAIMPTA